MPNPNLPCGCKTVPHTCDTLPVGTTTHVCSSVVCKTKTWGKCVLYGGQDLTCGGTTVVEFENDYDAIIADIYGRLCTLTPDGLNYAGFAYDCLRQDGGLGTGSAITTQQEFTEAAAAALCAINTRLLGIEKPSVTADCISGITPGTSTMVQVLNAIISKVCELDTVFALPITITDVDCFGITQPGSTDPIGDWFQWVIDNTCAINTNLTSLISAQTTRVNNINTYLHGSTTPSYPITYDISCTYMGGSATANLHATVTALITKLCALGATVSGLPDLSAISMAWATCFSAAPYSYSNTATSLQTQLDRILNVISREKVSFSSDFVVTDSACGKTIELDPSTIFDCSMLGTCSITSLSDVDGTPTCGDVLTYDGTNYVPVAKDTFVLLSGAVDGFDNVASYPGASVGPYLDVSSSTCGSERTITTGFLENPWDDLTSTIVSPNWGTAVTTTTFYGKKTFEGNILFRGIISAGATILSLINIPAGRTIATNLPTALRPNVDTIIDGNVIYKANGSNAEWALPGYFQITTSGSIIFFCNNVDPTAVGTRLSAIGNSTGDHYFSFYGKAIYQ